MLLKYIIENVHKSDSATLTLPVAKADNIEALNLLVKLSVLISLMFLSHPGNKSRAIPSAAQS